MSGFTAVLREKIETTQRSLEAAQHADHPFEVHLHSARLLDLLDRAQHNAVDTAGWVPETALSTAASNCA
jgi:NADH:ubiquinone oxidoreductase subunit E